jgi:Zn finger protein HypA/HybF involved in hydrogenase expression
MMQLRLAMYEIETLMKTMREKPKVFVCASCGKQIQKNKTGYCRTCYNASGLNGGNNRGRYKPRIKATCFQCKKDWMAEWYQHPKWSRCDECTAKIRQVDAGVRWLSQWSEV